ncbi:SRPBCC domain-containing protein [Candidatus Sulfidibacterium hydrothermale]|uniref:SRPBCC domain-containing protein n=1 Tax=Candidatus Sulfidibacterium hydrothermale TaxID=2875962 RepID=UPI001F0B4C88|nr:SRPBCC domain-containing protein [Candidatus Sulfidibacterium hydrothermale]UBM61593.1 SRPBCC domain-containing protein [Candidatus Sulfidibacterium hydrothermale]
MKNYKQYIKIDAEPEDVYACLTNPFTIELWSDMKAKMEAREGTEFELFDGDIAGKILELEPNKKVVQQWYFGDQETPSIVTFKIHPDKGKVSLELTHTNIPDEVYEEMAEGWKKYYLGRIKEFLELD